MRVAIITSQFNPEVTNGLKFGVHQVLKEKGIDQFVEYAAPGAFEIPLLAKRAALSKKFDAVICLGCVIKGDTAHFEYISLAATIGIQQVALETGVPIAFGILTTYTDEQAEVRSAVSGDYASHNKGREAALAAIEAALCLKQISQ